MRIFETIELAIQIFKICVVIMIIVIPIMVIKAIINEKKINDNVKEINKGLDAIDDMFMNSGSCMSCVYRGGNPTKLASSEIVDCWKLNKKVNWIEEDFSKEHPCPYFEGDRRLLTKRRG